MIVEIELLNGHKEQLALHEELTGAMDVCDYIFSREYVIANKRTEAQQVIIPTRAIQAVTIVTDEWEVEEGWTN